VHAVRGALLAELTDHRGLILDLTRLDFLASVGVGLLLEVVARAQEPGVLEFLLPPGGPVRRVLDMTGLTPVLTGPARRPPV
jgi:anti-anti-sigma factor